MIPPALTAAVNFVRAVRKHNAPSNSSGHGWLLFATIVVIGLFWVGLYYWDQIRKQRKRRTDSPGSLFAELCAVHQLGHSERAILNQAAQAGHIEQPALLFGDRALLERTLNTVATDPGQIQSLTEQLFGGAPLKTPTDITTA